MIDPSLTSVGHITVKHPYEKQKSLEKFITTDELKQWAENNRFPLFGLMDASNQNAYYETGRNPAMFIGTDKDFKQHGIVFRKLAVAFKKDFSFVWFQSNQEGAHSTLCKCFYWKWCNFSHCISSGSDGTINTRISSIYGDWE